MTITKLCDIDAENPSEFSQAREQFSYLEFSEVLNIKKKRGRKIR